MTSDPQTGLWEVAEQWLATREASRQLFVDRDHTEVPLRPYVAKND